MKRALLALAAVGLTASMTALVACSSDDTPAGPTTTANDAGTTTPGTDAATTNPGTDAATTNPGTDSGSNPGPLTGLPTDLVINEFSVVGGTEWLEIANKGGAIDISNFAVADTDKDKDDAGASKPKVSDAARFPPGTILAAGGHLVVLLSRKDMSVGPYPAAQCPGEAAACFSGVFGVSAASGEPVHILGPDNAIVTTVAYPNALSPNATLGQTACRVPDLTGPFAVCPATPAAANRQ